MEYDLAARKRLGREVRAARTRAGYTSRSRFADEMGRSARQLQALENGESGVGPDTWAAAAQVLGWPLERVYALLDGKPQKVRVPPSLAAVSDDDLAAEVLRRMKSGGERGGDTPATKAPGAGPGNVTELRLPPDADLDDLPDEADDPPPIGGGRQMPDAARRTDED